jgi:hypothetical protein
MRFTELQKILNNINKFLTDDTIIVIGFFAVTLGVIVGGLPV